MPEKFPFARYFGDITILAELQLQGRAPIEQRPPRAPEPRDLLLRYCGTYPTRPAGDDGPSSCQIHAQLH